MNGIINLDSDFAKEIGFTSDKFDGYLWRDGKRIIISFIWSLDESKGNLSRLFDQIEKKGFKVSVPTPFARMKMILKRKRFIMHIENDPRMGPVEIWEK